MWCFTCQRQRGVVQHGPTSGCRCCHVHSTFCYACPAMWLCHRRQLVYSCCYLQQDDFLVARIAMEEGIAREYSDNDFVLLSKDDPNVRTSSSFLAFMHLFERQCHWHLHSLHLPRDLLKILTSKQQPYDCAAR